MQHFKGISTLGRRVGALENCDYHFRTVGYVAERSQFTLRSTKISLIVTVCQIGRVNRRIARTCLSNLGFLTVSSSLNNRMQFTDGESPC